MDGAYYAEEPSEHISTQKEAQEEDESSPDSKLRSEPSSEPAATSNKTNSNYTPPTEAQAKSVTYWLNRPKDSYDFKDTHLMISAMDGFVDSLRKEYEERYEEYCDANTFAHIFGTRTKQIDTAITMIDWYEDYIKNNHDEVNEIYGGEEMDVFLEQLFEAREDLEVERLLLEVESENRSKYKSRWEWDKANEPEIDFESQSLESIISKYFAYYDEDGKVHFLENEKVIRRHEEIVELMLKASYDEWWKLYKEKQMYEDEETANSILSNIYYSKILEKYPPPDKYTTDNVGDYMGRIKIFLEMDEWNADHKKEVKEIIKAFYGDIGKPGYLQKYLSRNPNTEMESILRQLNNLIEIEYKSGGYGFNEGFGVNSLIRTVSTIMKGKEQRAELESLVERAEKENKIEFELGRATGTIIASVLISEMIASKIVIGGPFDSAIVTKPKEIIRAAMTSGALAGVHELGNIVSKSKNSKNIIEGILNEGIKGAMQQLIGSSVSEKVFKGPNVTSTVKAVAQYIVEEVIGSWFK